MKKLLFVLISLIFVVSGYCQVTPGNTWRIVNSVSAFEQNISHGDIVIDLSTNKEYQATAAVASTETLTTASGSFVLYNTGGTLTSIGSGYGWTASPNPIISTGNGIVDTTVILSKTRAGHDYQTKLTGLTNFHLLKWNYGSISNSIINTYGSTDIYFSTYSPGGSGNNLFIGASGGTLINTGGGNTATNNTNIGVSSGSQLTTGYRETNIGSFAGASANISYQSTRTGAQSGFQY